MLDTGGGMVERKRKVMSYKKLQIWILAREVVIEVHDMTMKLPKFELYEEGSQIRRSSKTTKATIVEGYGRRRYKQDWIKSMHCHQMTKQWIILKTYGIQNR